MQDRIVYNSPVPFFSLERAEKIVPPEFRTCYAWFIEHTGEKIPRLPHRMENPPATPIPLSRDSGIYIPSSSRVEYDGQRRYALSIHSTGKGNYDDASPIQFADGTWVLDYAAHAGKDLDQGYNAALINCLHDGIPVGVMFKEPPGYRVLGLAYVEQFNSASMMFTLHGPITPQTEAEGLFANPDFVSLPQHEQQLLMELDGTDERLIVKARQVRRQQQGQFRKNLFDAYRGACAISGVTVPEVLQAAHINPYRGRKSQIASNGILLRADLHLLYDAHLISVEPDSLNVAMSDRLARTPYVQYNQHRLYEPQIASNAPNRELLAAHYRQFRQENRVLVA